jgi:hypothetical protein
MDRVATASATPHSTESAAVPAARRGGTTMKWNMESASAMADVGRPGAALSHRFSAEPAVAAAAIARIRGTD